MEFQTNFQWNKSFEAGLPTDKEIVKNPDNTRIWIVQSAMARVLSELMDLAEFKALKETAAASINKSKK